jgi:WSC domain
MDLSVGGEQESPLSHIPSSVARALAERPRHAPGSLLALAPRRNIILIRCSGSIPPPLASQDLTDTMCNEACPGDPSSSCGAPGWLSVYYDPTKYVAGANPALYGPQTPQTVGNYVLQGCYSEGTAGRALSSKTPTAPTAGFTLELCEAACQGYTYWGMEYSNQCYCGNSLAAGSVNQTSLVPSVSGCNMLCKSIHLTTLIRLAFSNG